MAVAERVAPFQQHSYSDLELVSAVRRGSERAFEELYGRYFARVRGYVLGMVRDYGRAEDLTQEVFFAALRRLKATESPIAFKPWIFEIAKNAAIDEFRRTRRGHEVPLEAEDGDSRDERWASAAPAPEAAVENKQRLADLRGAFHGLSESQHELIVMREFEGLSYDQIGQRMGMSRPVVESSLFRARRKLEEEYQEIASGRRCQAVQGAIASGDERSLRSLGVRQRRMLSRHLSHCQPCRRVARDVHLGESWFKAPPLRSKLAALLPFGWWRWRKRNDEDPAASIAATLPHHPLFAPPWTSLAALSNVTASMPGAGRAAAVAAAIAVAGLGGSAITGIGNSWIPGSSGGTTHSQASPHKSGRAPAAAAGSAFSGGKSTATVSASAVVAGATQFQAPGQPGAVGSAAGRRASAAGGLGAPGTGSSAGGGSAAGASNLGLPAGATASPAGIPAAGTGQAPTLPGTPTVGAPGHRSGFGSVGSATINQGVGAAPGAVGTAGQLAGGVTSTPGQAVPGVTGQGNTIADGVAASAGNVAAAAASTVTAASPVPIPIPPLPAVSGLPSVPGGLPIP